MRRPHVALWDTRRSSPVLRNRPAVELTLENPARHRRLPAARGQTAKDPQTLEEKTERHTEGGGRVQGPEEHVKRTKLVISEEKALVRQNAVKFSTIKGIRKLRRSA